MYIRFVMKQVSTAEFKRLEQKINLLNDKVDRLMEAQGIELVKGEDLIQKEEEKKRKIRERQQQELLRKERFQQQLKQLSADRWLVAREGGTLMRQFNLYQPPSAARIREYQRTNDPGAFNGLKRAGLDGRNISNGWQFPKKTRRKG